MVATTVLVLLFMCSSWRLPADTGRRYCTGGNENHCYSGVPNLTNEPMVDTVLTQAVAE